jgi:hypothetical protein
MRTRTVLLSTIVLLAFVLSSCLLSELSWSSKENSKTSLFQVTGLSSLVVGNLNPSARNPGLELFCTSLYDVPGGYCYYFSSGVPPISRINVNITVSNPK